MSGKQLDPMMHSGILDGEITGSHEGFINTSATDLSLSAFKASKKGKNPDLPDHQEAMIGPH